MPSQDSHWVVLDALVQRFTFTVSCNNWVRCASYLQGLGAVRKLWLWMKCFRKHWCKRIQNGFIHAVKFWFMVSILRSLSAVYMLFSRPVGVLWVWKLSEVMFEPNNNVKHISHSTLPHDSRLAWLCFEVFYGFWRGMTADGRLLTCLPSCLRNTISCFPLHEHREARRYESFWTNHWYVR